MNGINGREGTEDRRPNTHKGIWEALRMLERGPRSAKNLAPGAAPEDLRPAWCGCRDDPGSSSDGAEDDVGGGDSALQHQKQKQRRAKNAKKRLRYWRRGRRRRWRGSNSDGGGLPEA